MLSTSTISNTTTGDEKEIPFGHPAYGANKSLLKIIGNCNDAVSKIINNMHADPNSLTSLQPVDFTCMEILSKTTIALNTAYKSRLNILINLFKTAMSLDQARSLYELSQFLREFGNTLNPQQPPFSFPSSSIEVMNKSPNSASTSLSIKAIKKNLSLSQVLIENLKYAANIARHSVRFFTKHNSINGLSQVDRISLSLIIEFLRVVTDAANNIYESFNTQSQIDQHQKLFEEIKNICMIDEFSSSENNDEINKKENSDDDVECSILPVQTNNKDKEGRLVSIGVCKVGDAPSSIGLLFSAV